MIHIGEFSGSSGSVGAHAASTGLLPACQEVTWLLSRERVLPPGSASVERKKEK